MLFVTYLDTEFEKIVCMVKICQISMIRHIRLVRPAKLYVSRTIIIIIIMDKIKNKVYTW